MRFCAMKLRADARGTTFQPPVDLFSSEISFSFNLIIILEYIFSPIFVN